MPILPVPTVRPLQTNEIEHEAWLTCSDCGEIGHFQFADCGRPEEGSPADPVDTIHFIGKQWREHLVRAHQHQPHRLHVHRG